MKPQTELSAQELYQKKERFYPRNFISLMFEGFTFSFALAMFSPENVLPVYVASLSDKAIYIALISALYYGFSYGAPCFPACWASMQKARNGSASLCAFYSA